jgi:hypothetical protein
MRQGAIGGHDRPPAGVVQGLHDVDDGRVTVARRVDDSGRAGPFGHTGPGFALQDEDHLDAVLAERAEPIVQPTRRARPVGPPAIRP